MWKKLPYSQPFFISLIQKNGYFIYMTDFINIWWTNYKENEFLSVLKKSNDDLEMENDNQLVQIGLKMLSCPENLKKLHINCEGRKLNVTMAISSGFPIYLEIQLTEGSREMFFEKVTQNLLKIVHDLKASENELRFLLIKKDKEIEEYKSETDVRLAMYLKTEIFHDEEHMEKHTMYQRNFGTSNVPECLLERETEKPEYQVIVKQENKETESVKVKSETKSQEIIKNEIESQVPGSCGVNEISTDTVKREVKCESLSISPRKKLRKMLKI